MGCAPDELAWWSWQTLPHRWSAAPLRHLIAGTEPQKGFAGRLNALPTALISDMNLQDSGCVHCIALAATLSICCLVRGTNHFHPSLMRVMVAHDLVALTVLSCNA
jgi:hypothetical protein